MCMHVHCDGPAFFPGCKHSLVPCDDCDRIQVPAVTLTRINRWKMDGCMDKLNVPDLKMKV